MNITSAAQLEFEPLDEAFSSTGASTSALKIQAAERLAAHRARRNRSITPELPGLITNEPRVKSVSGGRAEQIAAAVAERYAQSQSYRSFLAAEAERAIEQAQAAVEIAARSAEAIVATQQQLLSELEEWTPQPAGPALVEQTSPIQQLITADLTVRLYEDVGRSATTGNSNAVPLEYLEEEERLALEAEIAFRHSPTLVEFHEPATTISANLIEFPRQLVASRKARPRLAEGPLREESDLSQDNAQLRIFEVQADQISIEPTVESTVPEWSSIRLGAHTATESYEAAENLPAYIAPVLLTAPLGLRLMAAVVDGCIIFTAFLGFATVASYTAGQLPRGILAGVAAAITLAALSLLYQLLFFTFSDGTPGMRYARIGLCTFSDDNPTRSAMRRRLIAVLLAACPAGVGLFWAFLDDDRLGWHDRISGMYQRSY